MRVLRHDGPGLGDESDEDVEVAARERHRLAVSRQPAGVRVQLEPVEQVAARHGAIVDP
jgi:hypothetical protein